MEAWIDSLTEPQKRALAHQSGIAGFMGYPIDKLTTRLKESEETNRIYEETYLAAANYEEHHGNE